MAVLEKPDLDDALLIHYGVAGMKWGHRKQGGSTDIKKARANVSARNEKYQSDKNKAKAITNGRARAKALKDLQKSRVTDLKNPDRVLAARMTRGEKGATLALGLVTGVGLPIAIGAIAGTSGRSRRIERKQDTEAYQVKNK